MTRRLAPSAKKPVRRPLAELLLGLARKFGVTRDSLMAKCCTAAGVRKFRWPYKQVELTPEVRALFDGMIEELPDTAIVLMTVGHTTGGVDHYFALIPVTPTGAGNAVPRTVRVLSYFSEPLDCAPYR